MAKIIAFANQKGGVGKTTSAINIAAALGVKNKKVLLIDFDPQGSSSSGVGVRKAQTKHTIYDVLIGRCRASDITIKTEYKNLDVLPSGVDLAAAELELADFENRQNRLRDAIAEIKDKYHYIIIDCPPSLGMLTVNALTAADGVIVPMQCEYFALEGITLLLQTVQKVQKEINPKLEIGGIFFTMFDSRTRLAQDVVMQVKSYFKDVVFNTIIPRNVRLSEAPSHGLPICKYDPTCIGAKSYEKLAEEVIRRG